MFIQDAVDAEPKLFSLSRNDITTFKLNDANLEEDATEVLSLDEETLNTSDPSEQSVENKKESEESYADADTSVERKISGRVLEYAYEPKTFQDQGTHIQEETTHMEGISVDCDDMKQSGDALTINIDTKDDADAALQLGEVAESSEDNMKPFEEPTSELLVQDHPIDEMSESNDEDDSLRYEFTAISDDINRKKAAEITEDNITQEEEPTTLADCTPSVNYDDSMHATARATDDDNYLNEITENVDETVMTFEELTVNAAENTAEPAKTTEVNIAFLDEFAAAAAPEEYDVAADLDERAEDDTALDEDLIMTTAATDNYIHTTEEAVNDSSLGDDVTEMTEDTVLPMEELAVVADNTADLIESLEDKVLPDDIHTTEEAVNDSSLGDDVTEMIEDTLLSMEELAVVADNTVDLIESLEENDSPEEQLTVPAVNTDSNSTTAELFEGVEEDTATLKELTIATAAAEDAAAGLLEINHAFSRQSNEIFAADSERVFTETTVAGDQQGQMNENTEVDDITIKATGVAYAKSTETTDAMIFDEIPLTNKSEYAENQDTNQCIDFDALSFDETVTMQPSTGVTDREAVFDNDVFDHLLPDMEGPISITDDARPEPLESTTQQIPKILDDIADADPQASDNINEITTVEADQLPSDNAHVTDKDFSAFNSALCSFESTSVHDEANEFSPDADTASIDDDFDYNERTFVNDYDEVPEEADSILIQEDFTEPNECSQEELSRVDDADDNRNDAAAIDQSLSYDTIMDGDRIEMDARSEAEDDILNNDDIIKNDIDVESPKESTDVDLVDMNSNHDEYMNWSIEEDEETVKAGDSDVNNDDSVAIPIQQRTWTSSSMMESSASRYDTSDRLSLIHERRLDLQTRREKSASTIMRFGNALNASNGKMTLNQAEQLYIRLMEHRKRIDEKLKALRKERDDEELKYVRKNHGSRTLSAKEAEQLFDRLYRVDTISRSYAKGTLLPYESMNRVKELPMTPRSFDYSSAPMTPKSVKSAYDDTHFW